MVSLSCSLSLSLSIDGNSVGECFVFFVVRVMNQSFATAIDSLPFNFRDLISVMGSILIPDPGFVEDVGYSFSLWMNAISYLMVLERADSYRYMVELKSRYDINEVLIFQLHFSRSRESKKS
ncbi:hypothetical protein L2E82_01898 [Cichorium intybus]|uniref:Uncharacterized protein n=1 Tax=Cichorium intybus TaxID=13427 RepID=A0ACB9H1Q5_CICIN|nr:hypothetical protein L2E82_01898 [Cichorium intybus]